jgi:hypothetical protein
VIVKVGLLKGKRTVETLSYEEKHWILSPKMTPTKLGTMSTICILKRAFQNGVTCAILRLVVNVKPILQALHNSL